MELFTFIDALFDRAKWENVSDNEKYKHSFMTYRFLSIRYPVEINNCQIIGLQRNKTAKMMDFWHHILIKAYRTKPAWLRTKSGKKPKLTDVLGKVDKHTISLYCSKHYISSKDLGFLCELFPKEIKKEIKKFELKQ